MHWAWYLVLTYISLPLLYLVIPFIHKNATSRKRVTIIVLGDLNHSPRMNYHAKSFIDKGYVVDLCGYLEPDQESDLTGYDDKLRINTLPVYTNSLGLPFVLFALWKVAAQVFTLFYLLWDLRGSNYILMQNPPSIPILLISIIYKYIFGSKLIIDWHNLNYTILSIKLGESHPLVLICKAYEQYLSKFANLNLTVTKSMKEYLINEFKLEKKSIIVLYDKPNNTFKPVTTTEKKGQLIQELTERYPQLYKDLKKDEKIIVSSTSFTPDEDFNILLSALKSYEYYGKSISPLRVIITGKGPLQADFLSMVNELNFKKITVHSVWLAFEDYPKVLSLADLGISLHASSSGLDLPMKIVDMFGCGIPVISLNFPAIGELVEDEVNGIIVNDSEEMFEKLKLLVSNSEKLQGLKKNAVGKSKERWNENWEDSLGRILPN